ASRLPLRDVQTRPLRHYDLRFRSRSRIALAATAVTPWGPVRIFNTHLDTRLNTQERLKQLEPVVGDSAAFGGPGIIGGDFNSNSFHWLGHVLPVPALHSQAYGVHEFMQRERFQTALSTRDPTFDYLG